MDLEGNETENESAIVTPLNQIKKDVAKQWFLSDAIAFIFIVQWGNWESSEKERKKNHKTRQLSNCDFNFINRTLSDIKETHIIHI